MTDATVAPVQPTVRPTVELFRSNVIALWATTYNIDLALFNEFLLARLGDPPRNIAVIADGERLASALERIPPEKVDQLSAVNRRWLLREGPSGSGRFHPKSYLSVTPTKATLLVGSGNLSTGGLDDGREVFTEFHSGTPVGDATIEAWRAWMRRLVNRIGDTTLAQRFADLEVRLPRRELAVVDETAMVLHNLDRPLLDQMCERVKAAVGRAVEELVLAAPFFDRDARAVAQLIERLAPKRLTVYISASTSVDGQRLQGVLEQSGSAVTLMALEPDRFTHAKLIAAVAGEDAWVLSGSANLSRAALTLTPPFGNVELAVMHLTSAHAARALFVPPGVSVRESMIAELAALTYDEESEADSLQYAVRLTRATTASDGHVEVECDPPFGAGWFLDDLQGRTSLVQGERAVRTSTPLAGRLVHIVDADGSPQSNRVVVDDPVTLDAVLRGSSRSRDERPPELLSGDVDTPVGRALVWLHQNLLMDVNEAAPGGAGRGAGSAEGDVTADDDLWERLEREQLGRDPRANAYGRMLGKRATPGLSEPILELLETMRNRAPALDQADRSASGQSVLRLLREEAEAEAEDDDQADPGEPKRRWKVETRIRVRARNVLRRWAAAQNDPRLIWIDPLAPAANFAAVATTFARLSLAAGLDPESCELRASDLTELWLEWMRPFMGTGRGDGWIDAVDLKDAAVVSRLPPELREVVAALSWLAVRGKQRETMIAWQPILATAFDRGLLDVTDESARFVSVVAHSSVQRGDLEDDILHCIMFIDDALWSERTAVELGLDGLRLDAGSPGHVVSVRLYVKGISSPLEDPRLAQLIIAVRRYRRCDGVAVFSEDVGWRLVVETGQSLAFKRGSDEPMIESTVEVAAGLIEGLASNNGVLVDFFARDQVA